MRTIGLLVGGLALVLSSPRSSIACLCSSDAPSLASVAGALEHAELVFTGRMTDIQAIDEGEGSRVTFRVHRAWKGVEEEEVITYTRRTDATCGYRFVTGSDYLVYANPDAPAEAGGLPITHICTRTRSLAEGESTDIPLLGKPIYTAVERTLWARIKALFAE